MCKRLLFVDVSAVCDTPGSLPFLPLRFLSVIGGGGTDWEEEERGCKGEKEGEGEDSSDEGESVGAGEKERDGLC